MKRAVLYTLCGLLLAGAGFVAQRWFSGDNPTETHAGRLHRLRHELREVEASMDKAAAEYTPKVEGDITDLSADAAAILRQLPGVESVTVTKAEGTPTGRVIHFEDIHAPPLAMFAEEARRAGELFTEEEIGLLHTSLRLECEKVCRSRNAALRCLAEHHGLEAVFLEGVTEDDEGYELRLGPSRLKVMALDDATLLERGNPLRDGYSDADRERREDHMAEVLLKGKVSVCVLGGAHDLADNLKEAGNRVEVVRVRPTHWPE